MAGRGPQSFKKRQKEQQRKEKQLEKAQKRVERKTNPINAEEEELVVGGQPKISMMPISGAQVPLADVAFAVAVKPPETKKRVQVEEVVCE